MLKDLKSRALDAVALKRKSEVENFAELLEEAENKAKGHLEGLLLRILNVRPCMSFARVIHNEGRAANPDAFIEIESLLLCAHHVQTTAPLGNLTGYIPRFEYVLYLVQKCVECSGLIYGRQIHSLEDLGAAIEANAGASPAHCWACTEDDDPFAE